MFDHVTIRVADREASERFYATVLRALGQEPAHALPGEFVEWEDFSLAAATAEKPITRGLHIAFFAPDRAHVDAFWQAGVDAGHRDAGAPGPRPQYGDDYYGGFLLDPDGNSVEAVHLAEDRRPGRIDHLWIRVADVATAGGFYEVIAPHCGFVRAPEVADRAHFRGTAGTFSLVDGPPTQNAHVAFHAGDRAAVDAFHRAAVDAGYRDNGAPGERPEYHAGYYAAFVLDPDGNNVEAVDHGR